MVVTFDTNILIWGLRGVSSNNQEEMIVRAKAFFEQLKNTDTKVVLTSECVAEYLVGEANEKRRQEQYEVLCSQFMVIPFDVRSALIAAKLRSDEKFIESLKDDLDKTRVSIKADIAIVSTSKAYGIDSIYSHDAGLRRLADACGLPCRDLPTLEELNSSGRKYQARGLFDENDDEDL